MSQVSRAGRHHRVLPIALAAVLALSLHAGCERGEPAQAKPAKAEEHFSDPVAVVNGAPIYHSTYNEILVAMRARVSQNDPDGVEKYLSAKSDALERAIDEQLLYQEAVRRGYGISDEQVEKIFEDRAKRAGGEDAYLQAAIARQMSKNEVMSSLRREATINQFVRKDIEKDISASDDEVRAFYDARPDLFTPDPWVDLAHIFVAAPLNESVERRSEALSRISVALDRIRKGKSFESVAREVSEDATAELGGRWGLFKKGNLPRDLDKAAFDLPKGGVSQVIQTDAGYEILKVLDRTGGKLEPFDKVKDRARDEVLKKKRNDRLKSLVATLRKSAKIERLLG